MNAITAFSWGYWGWGTEVEKFLEAAAVHEAAAGFDVPAFADVRLRREVRAKSFNGNALEQMVGADRYRWFPGLGNAMVASGGKGIKIAKPADAKVLLDYVAEQASNRRRVIFFCACEWIESDGKECCHRRIVADLLLKTAAEQGTRLVVVEWPGGEPRDVELRVPRGGKVDPKVFSLPLGKNLSDDGIETTPWGSAVYILKGKELVEFFLAGPAKFRGGRWKLPIGETAATFDAEGHWQSSIQAEAFRKRIGVRPRHSWK